MTDVVVLGAGMVGVSVALALVKRGKSVVLVDRKGPAAETSFGNAGVIEREALEPVVMPRNILKLLKYGLNQQPEAHYHLSFLHKGLPLLWNLFRSGAPEPMAHYARANNALLALAIPEHWRLAAEIGAERFYRQGGWIRMYRGEKSFAETAYLRGLADTYGLKYQILSPGELKEMEPALKETGYRSILWPETDTVSSPGGVVEATANHFVAEGGRLVIGDARTLRIDGNAWTVDTAEGPITAARAVVALGPWSADILKPFGLKIPLAVKRGYHMHFVPPAPSLTLPIVDNDIGYVVTPMEAGIRLTTGVEIADREAPPTPVQIKRTTAYARKLLDLGPEVDAEPWMGRRPVLPDNLPIIGPAPGSLGRGHGLWLAFGHGHLGFTQGPITGQLIAQMMAGEKPEIDMGPFRAERF